MLLWVAAAALADPPNQTVRLWKISDAGLQVERMAVSDDAGLIVGRTRGDLSGWLLDVDSWNLLPFGGCEVTGVAPIALTDGTTDVWISCGNGDVIGKSWDGEQLSDLVDGSGVPVVFEAIDESLSGIFWDPTSALLYAPSVAGDGLSRLHVIDPFALAWDAAVFSTYPKDLAWPGFNEAAVVNGYLIVSHGGQDMSSIQLGSDAALSVPSLFTTRIDCDDLHPSPFGGVYCVDELGQVADYRPITNLFNLLPLGVLLEPKAVCANPDLTDGWLAVTGLQVKVWEMDQNGGIPDPEPYFQGPDDADNPIQDMVTSEGYLYGGGISGNLHVVTARPWVYPNLFTVEPASGVAGDPITVSFRVDEDVDWVLYRGGDRYGVGGVELASGSASGEQTVTTEVVLDTTWAEGENRIYLVATNAAALTGHARASIAVDNPPDAPALTDANVGFADGALVLSFDGIPDEDLDRYSVYVRQTPWDGADWPTGGPAFDGETRLKTPIEVPSAGGARVTLRIEPLENDVTYYIGVRAWDQGGKEGPMSRIVKGTPSQTFSAAELAGEDGGSPCDEGCSTGGRGAAGWLGLGLVGAVVAGRRRRSAVGASAVLIAFGLGGEARAQDDDPWWKQDATPSRGNFELRYGVIGFDPDNEIRQVYDRNPTNLLQGEFGPQFFRVAEVDFGFGFFQELSNTVSGGGIGSGETTMLTWFPFAIDGTLRLHVLDEQPVVPFVRYGWDYVLWSEKWDDGAGGKEVVRGAKTGTHWSLGANLLLDLIQPGRASFLEAQTGINDSWLTVEWRRQRVDDRSAPWAGPTDGGLDFSGDAILVGLKLDY